jgi:hypothetical protein
MLSLWLLSEAGVNTGPSVATCNALLDALCNATSYSVATPYLQLHIDDPGASGTANVASETTRKLVAFAAASGAAIVTDANVSWPSITGSQNPTYWTLWDSASGGTFLWSGELVGSGYTAGDLLVITAGGFDITVAAAS